MYKYILYPLMHLLENIRIYVDDDIGLATADRLSNSFAAETSMTKYDDHQLMYQCCDFVIEVHQIIHTFVSSLQPPTQ